jgi:hypothetical protein
MMQFIQSYVHGVSSKAADIAAVTSVGGAGVSFLPEFNTLVQIGAGMVAIFAGLAAGAFHIIKLYWAHQDRKNSQ